MSNAEITRELALRAARGDVNAFQDLYLATRQGAYFVALSITKNEHDAQDILQESYLKAYQSMGQLDQPERFAAWLNQIVANKAKNYIARKKPDSFADYEDDSALNWQEETDPGFLPDVSLDQAEAKALIAAMVKELPEDQRLVVLLHYYDDLEVAEIAGALEIPEGTVKSRLSRARQKLAAMLREAQNKGIRLRAIAPIPLLAYFIKMLPLEPIGHDKLPPIILGALGTGGAAAAGVAAAGTKTAAGALKHGASVLLSKGAAVAAAATIAVSGVAVGVYTYSKRQNTREAAISAAANAVSTGVASIPSAAQTGSAGDTQAHNVGMPAPYSERAQESRTEKAPPPGTTTASKDSGNTAPPTTTAQQTTTTAQQTTTTAQQTITTAQQTTTATTTNRPSTATRATWPSWTTRPWTTWPPRTAATTMTTAAATTAEPSTEETTTEPKWHEFDFDPGTGWLNGYRGNETDLVVPAEIGGVKVKHLADNVFEGNAYLERVVLPEDIHCIRNRTFGGCAALREITIPGDVRTLIDTAFEGCPDDLLIICKEGSLAHTFAEGKGYAVEFC